MRSGIISLCIAVFSLTLAARDSQEVKKKFNTVPGKQVVIDFHDSDGDVTVGSNDKNEIAVEFVKEYQGRTGSSSHRYFQSIEPVFDFSGNRLRLEIQYPRFYFSFSFHSIRVRTRILTPRNSDVTIRLSDGDARVQDLEGRIELVSSDGDLEMSDCKGDFSFRTSDGNVVIRNGKGRLKAHASDGDISGEGQFQFFDIEASDGNCQMTLQDGSKLEENCRIRTSDGNIKISYPADLAFRLEAAAGDGDVRNMGQFDRIILQKRNRMEAERGNAKSLVSIRTSDGDIEIRQNTQQKLKREETPREKMN